MCNPWFDSVDCEETAAKECHLQDRKQNYSRGASVHISLSKRRSIAACVCMCLNAFALLIIAIEHQYQCLDTDCHTMFLLRRPTALLTRQRCQFLDGKESIRTERNGIVGGHERTARIVHSSSSSVRNTPQAAVGTYRISGKTIGGTNSHEIEYRAPTCDPTQYVHPWTSIPTIVTIDVYRSMSIGNDQAPRRFDLNTCNLPVPLLVKTLLPAQRPVTHLAEDHRSGTLRRKKEQTFASALNSI